MISKIKLYKHERDALLLYSVLLTIFAGVTGYFFITSSPGERFIFDANYTFGYRDDVAVRFSQEIVDRFNVEFIPEGDEYLLCLIGEQNGEAIIVHDVVEEDILEKTPDYISYKNDPPCQINGAIGSIHSHTDGACHPSRDDLFTFGEMKNPEPIINIIQCDFNNLYIMKMPGKQERFDFRSLRWEVKG